MKLLTSILRKQKKNSMHIKDEAPVVEIDLFKNNCEKKNKEIIIM